MRQIALAASRRIGWVALLAFCTAARAAESGAEKVAAPSARRMAVGVSSCSAQPCHGSVKPDAPKLNLWDIHGDEVTVWIERDPHAQAYRVLSNDLSKAIANRLKLGVSANEADRCLRCHSPFDVGSTVKGATRLADGVGCEACHGPAHDWLAAHTMAGWRQKSAEEKSKLGMVETRNLHARTRACAACHVGAAPKEGQPGDDVDHDLIAAGHPALKFELTAYLAKMPKHWDEKDPATGRSPARADFEAQAWAVGQTTSAAAALDLLAYRAAQGGKKAWPEFAEYDCYSCHHQLYGTGRTARPAVAGQPAPKKGGDIKPSNARPLGLPTWGTWYLSLRDVPPGDRGGATQAVTEIERLVQTPNSDRRSLARAASDAARQFDDWGRSLAKNTSSTLNVIQLLARMKEEAPRIGRPNWDGEAQLYLALVAMHYARHGAQRPPRDDPLTRSLRETREQLMFPTSSGGDRRFDSPRDLDPIAALRDRLLPEIERLLKE